MAFQNCKDDKQNELVAIIVRPKHFPQSQHVLKWELALEGDKDPAEAEEEVKAISFLCIEDAVSDCRGVCNEKEPSPR